MSSTANSHGITLGVGVSLASMALACVPKVSAQIVVTEPKPESGEAEGEGEAESTKAKPKRGDRMPPEIIRAEYIGEGHLRLHFSEPIAVPDKGFDPNDFRLSVLSKYEYEGYEGPDYPSYPGYGYGYDYGEPESLAHGSYQDFGYSYYGTRLSFVRWRHASTEIDLYFTPEISPYACRQISRYGGYGPPGASYDNGLFLHYAAGAIPLRDEQGYPLSDFGAQWVLEGRADSPVDYRDIDEASLERAGEGLLEVACEPLIPPGPR